MRLPLSAAFVVSTMSAALLSACAPSAQTATAQAETDEQAPSRCFRTENVRNFRADRQSDLYIRSGRDAVFQINTSGACWDVDTAFSIALAPASGGSGNVCVGDPINVLVPNAAPGRRLCRAFVVKSLTSEEVAALPEKARP